MALQIADRVKETTTTTGTGTITLGGAMTGFRAFSAVCSNADTIYYALQPVDGNGNPTGGWEVGLGTYTTTGNTLARTTVLASSNSGSAITLSGTTQVWGDMPAAVINKVVQPIAFHAQNTTNFSVPYNAATVVTGWTSVKDTTNGAWNASTGVFTAPVAGWYAISCSFQMSSAAWPAGCPLDTQINVNGSRVAYTEHRVETAVTTTMGMPDISCVYYLNAGDTVSAAVYQAQGGATTLSGLGNGNFFSIASLGY